MVFVLSGCHDARDQGIPGAQAAAQMAGHTTVFIVDQDDGVRRALSRLLETSHFDAVCLDSMNALLDYPLPDGDAVIVADVRTVRGPSETLPACLHGQVTRLPVIYTTDYDTELARREARRLGAAGYFRRPLDQQALVDAINFAVMNNERSGTRGASDTPSES
jgi:FixJ family two-component response regulator